MEKIPLCTGVLFYSKETAPLRRRGRIPIQQEWNSTLSPSESSTGVTFPEKGTPSRLQDRESEGR